MRIVPVLVVLLLSTGCFIRETRMRESMEPWLGHDIHDVVADWGGPTLTYQNGQTTIYEWKRTGATETMVYGNENYATASTRTNSCRAWFVVNGSDRVISWHWQGHC